MSKVIITADSTCDLSPQIIKDLNISILPMYVNIGDDSYQDGINITPDDVFETFEKNGVLAKTAAIPVYDFQTCFQKHLEQGFEIIHISIGSLFSSSYQSALSAANILESDKISVIDSCNLSTGCGHLVMAAAELAKKGLGRKEIVENLNSLIPRINASFIIDTLTFLWKGGRCSSVVALGANVLQLKPCIEVIDGEMKVGKKYRGHLERCLSSYVEDRLTDLNKIDPKRIFITHSGCNDKILSMVKDKLESKNYFKEIIITRAGCTVSCHCGRNTLGILYYWK
jgi:fatty acid kinase fatty acid binding subunit